MRLTFSHFNPTLTHCLTLAVTLGVLAYLCDAYTEATRPYGSKSHFKLSIVSLFLSIYLEPSCAVQQVVAHSYLPHNVLHSPTCNNDYRSTLVPLVFSQLYWSDVENSSTFLEEAVIGWHETCVQRL